MNIKRVYLKEIQVELNCKDRRSASRWCRINGVSLFKDIGSNKYFVLKSEFEKAMTIAVNGYLDNQTRQSNQYGKELKNNYKLAHHESEFLARLRKIKHEI